MIKHLIKKNFLDKELFNKFKKEMFSTRCGWYYQPHQCVKDRGYFGHNFYAEHRPNSDFFTPFIVPITFMLGAKMLDDVRANCILKDSKKHFSEFHTDRPYDCTTSILYMNTNNGYTLLGEKEKIKIKSEENKIVTFNSQIKHCAVSQTDADRRIVINFNYI
jgi:hypothetical protein